jgi:anaerobic magnesium-protoporphyrin IX monomethyl ester cyclase
MKVVLSTPPGKTTELWPPLGLLYIASSTRTRRSDDIRVIDAFCENLTKEELVRRVVAEKPDVFGMNCSTHTFLSSIEALEDIKKALPETRLVLGGFHATFAAERILREYPFVDFILKGEAEEGFPDLLDKIQEGTDASSVAGISHLRKGTLVDKPIALIEDLDKLPFPDRELVKNVEYGYSLQGIPLTFGKFTTISTSRGCPFKCTYCSCAAFSLRKWRARSAESVADELETLYSDGYECCVFVDDNFTHSRKRVEAICQLIKQKRIKMQFYCEGRVDNASSEMLTQMKRAGFNVIYFGVESGSQKILDYYKKNITPERARTAVSNAKKAGMIVVTSYIIGSPEESLEDIQKTIDFISTNRPHGIQINILDCLIGTPIWDDLVEKGVVGDGDWMRNHRIYEYNQNGFSKEKLEELVNQGYAKYIDSWKTWSALPEIAKLIFSNKTARRVITGNLFNPQVRKRISEGMRKN